MTNGVDRTNQKQLKKYRLIKGQRAAKYSTLTNLARVLLKVFLG
jgi:hypothetical protein